jgi:hypothetical protein
MSPGNERDLIHAIQVLASATALNAQVAAMVAHDAAATLPSDAKHAPASYQGMIERARDLRRFSRIG